MLVNILAVGLMSMGMGLSGVKEGTKQNLIAENQVTDLTNTTWYFNAKVDFTDDYTYNIEFTTNYESYRYNKMQFSITGNDIIYYIFYDASEPELSLNDTVYTFSQGGGGGNLIKHRINDTSNWINESWRTVNITGGTDATNSNLISLLNQNATLQSGGDTSESSESTTSENPMGDDIIGTIGSGLGIIGALATTFLTGFGNLFYAEGALTPFAIFALVMLGIAVSFAVVKLVLNLIRSNTGA